MTNEFNTAENELEVALKGYLAACLQAIRSSMVNQGLEEERPPVASTSISRTSRLFVDEYHRVISLEKQIQRAKAVINHSRNGSSAIVPLNALPVEVLTRIFQFVAETKSCKLDPWGSDYKKLPNYHIRLAHVCAYWRQIILSTPLFWSHIDVIPLLYTHERMRDRAQASLIHTGNSPLDIHITSPYPTDEYWETTGLREFLGPLVHRMRSLDLEIQIDDNQEDFDPEPSARDFCSSILSTCFDTSCSPGTLTQVSLEMETNCLFLEAAENAQQDDYMPLNVPHHLEDIWRHVTVLRLHNLSPPWTSVAYSGLIKLSLNSGEWRGGSISEHHLASIFSSSSQLRILDLGLPIIPASSPSKAVVLSDLKTLILGPKNVNGLETALRLIVPGSKPLNMTIHNTQGIWGDEFNKTTETAKFFARSNLIPLHFIGVGGCLKLLDLVNNIENIAFTIFNNEDVNNLAHGKPSRLNLRGLHILSDRRVDIKINELVQLVRSYAPRRFLLWGPCRVNNNDIRFDEMAQVEDALSIPGTIVKVLQSEPPKTPAYAFWCFE